MCKIGVASFLVLLQVSLNAGQSLVPSRMTAAEMWNPYTWYFPYGIAAANAWSDYLKNAQTATNQLYNQLQLVSNPALNAANDALNKLPGQQGTPQQLPSNNQQQPSNNQQQPSNNQQQPSNNQQQPSNNQQQPSNTQQQPSNNQQQPSNNQQQSSNDQQQPSNNQQQPSNDQQQPSANEQSSNSQQDSSSSQ